MKTPHIGITEREKQVLELLVRALDAGNKTPVNWVALELRVTPNTVSTALHRLRRRYEKAIQFGTAYRRWKRKLRGKYL